MQDSLIKSLIDLVRDQLNTTDTILRQNEILIDMIRLLTEREHTNDNEISPPTQNNSSERRQHEILLDMISVLLESEREREQPMDIYLPPSQRSSRTRTNRSSINSQPTLIVIDFDYEIPSSYPSEGEISHNTNIIIYSDIGNSEQTTCPISLEPFTPDERVMEIICCGHIFQESQLRQHLLTHYTCPMCRCDIRSTSSTPLTTTL